MDEIPLKNRTMILSEIGNHSKGTQFLTGNHLISNSLESVFDKLNHQIDGWYYGRIDLKYKSWEELLEDKNFKIVEINGVMSEPTHIYDATSGATFFDAVRTIKDNWKIMDKIALKIHLKYNAAYPKLLPFVKNMIDLRKHAKALKKLNKI
jgi:hypothetical protein